MNPANYVPLTPLSFLERTAGCVPQAHGGDLRPLARPGNVLAQLDAGVRIGAATPEAAAIGRRHTRRTMPW